MVAWASRRERRRGRTSVTGGCACHPDTMVPVGASAQRRLDSPYPRARRRNPTILQRLSVRAFIRKRAGEFSRVGSALADRRKL